MSIIKSLAFLLVIFLALAFGVGLLLPDSYSIERKLAIKAHPREVAKTLAEFDSWKEWTPWSADRDPDCTFSYAAGDEQGVGTRIGWNGPELGNGELKISKFDPETGVEYDLSFDGGKAVSKGGIHLQLRSNMTTNAVWMDEGQLDGVLERWRGVLMDMTMGPHLERGLENLRTRVENAKLGR